MKHKTFGKLAFLGVFAVAGCYSYASESINNGTYNTLQATPSFSRITVGDSDQVLVRLVNSADNGAVTSYTVNNPNSGIQVHFQPNYRPYQNAQADTLVADTGAKAQEEYYVVGEAPGTYTFTLTPTSVNTAVSATVTVVVTPHDLGAALSVHSILSGDTVTVTAPPGTVFSQDSSVVTVPNGTVAIVSRSADSSSITFVVSGGPLNVAGPVKVTHVGLTSSPTTQTSTIATTDSLIIPALTISMNKAAASPGDTVTLTTGPRAVFSHASAVTFTAGPTPAIVYLSPDSTVLKLLVGPGDSGNASVTNVGVVGGVAIGKFTLSTPTTILVGNITVAPTTLSNATPNVGQTITLALGGSLRFTNASQVLIGGVKAGIASVSADSSTATVLPMAFSSGAVTYTGIALSFLTSVPLALPAGQSVTVGATYGGPTVAGAGATGTAPTYTLTGSQTLAIADNGPGVACAAPLLAAAGGGSTCRYYKITVVAGNPTAIIKWSDLGADNDMAIFVAKSDGSACVAVLADNQGAVSGQTGDVGPPAYTCAENATTTLTAGTYLITVLNFGYTGAPWPAWIEFSLSQP